MKRMLSLLCLGVVGHAASAQDSARVLRDVEYAVVDAISLKLDLYLPDAPDLPTLIVWVHGGAWRSGSKDRVAIEDMLQRGFAIASVDYRLTPVAPFPANVHDIKAAIRFLRARADHFGYRKEPFVIAGASAGGHLAALVGVSNGHAALEGTVGEYKDQSSDIAAIVSFYGAGNLTTILKQSTPHGLGVRVPALQLLLGGSPEELPAKAKLASPVFHADASDPPLILIHGDQDPQMPINQSHELHGVYKRLGLPVHFEVVYGGGHGGAPFFDRERLDLVHDFLRKHLD
ncbi:MAG: alpha/beta hydrolase fold domain-containing protein [Opitutae bacterium]|nr:alpha/beta hydrolase fold domain-containing protein [Opitutae bacterium]MBC9888769.1 alpha/beta hydrolase fold domain-containing protein [Opitutae bacterium]